MTTLAEITYPNGRSVYVALLDQEDAPNPKQDIVRLGFVSGNVDDVRDLTLGELMDLVGLLVTAQSSILGGLIRLLDEH